jgi:hypothetical protein
MGAREWRAAGGCWRVLALQRSTPWLADRCSHTDAPPPPLPSPPLNPGDMCWLVRQGYCRFTCGLCGVDVAAAPCTQDPQAGAQAAADANPGEWGGGGDGEAGARWGEGRLACICV